MTIIAANAIRVVGEASSRWTGQLRTGTANPEQEQPADGKHGIDQRASDGEAGPKAATG